MRTALYDTFVMLTSAVLKRVTPTADDDDISFSRVLFAPVEMPVKFISGIVKDVYGVCL